MREDFFKVTSRAFYAFKLVIAPQREEIERLFSEWVWLLAERYPGHFPASRFSQSREFWTSSFFNFLASKKKVDQTESPFGSTVSFLTTHWRNELVRNCRNCDSREAEHWSGYLSESSRTHSEKSRLDFFSLRGNNWLESKKKRCLKPQKKNPP